MVRVVGTVLTLSLSLLLSASLAYANSELLNFNSLQNDQPVGNFYNGAGPGNTPNYGVTFSSNIFGLRPTSVGGAGNFSPDPTASPAIFINGAGPNVTGSMNVANGFSSGINFFYTAAFQETVTVWSGTNGTGTVLATITLSANNAGCVGPAYCNWSNIGVSFTGTGESVTFTGTGNGIGISDITIGQSTTAVPEPSSIYLLGSGLAGLCSRKIRRCIGA